MSNASYTVNEKRLLEILRKASGNELTSLEIVEKHYPEQERRPRYARQSVVCVLNSLVRKTRRYKNLDDFVVKKSDRAGPHPNNYWMETSDGYFKKLAPLFRVEKRTEHVTAKKPSNSKDEAISMKLPTALKARLENWIARQVDSPSPQQAIERVLNNYLPASPASEFVSSGFSE
ncbi:hypothetical protein DK847_00220 [Aestuariivirga litoralis]|uniref:Uncharacterized protein n=1 Tax=Aestuariivirga litoralis TaxID=2650924 RepID=A0A2W2BDK8_9HYPH|nr:hypothetical protein [Aestuariivirga litoralis]PZF78288.1 hypothetical protein DK847_00220 [Aestuariivirga litoralis]